MQRRVLAILFLLGFTIVGVSSGIAQDKDANKWAHETARQKVAVLSTLAIAKKNGTIVLS